MSMSRPSIAGAVSLVAAPVLVIVGTLVLPTVSDEAADQLSAVTHHRSGMIVGQTLSAIALVPLIAGTIWLAAVTWPRSRTLALVGGTLGVLGDLVVMFENGTHATAVSIVGGLDAANAATALDHISSSAMVKGLEPLSLLGDIGLLVLAIGAVRIGLPRWAAAALGIGALLEGAGFGSSTKALVILGFALVFVGAVMAVRAVATSAASDAVTTRPAQRVAV